jgi:acyl-CoA synthetase (NDP forming)
MTETGQLSADETSRFIQLFEPKSMAIVGVSEVPLKWGFQILYNTIHGTYEGRLYGVNPKHESILGIRIFPSVAELPEAVDLAMVVVPPPAVAGVIQECADRGIRSVLVITAGFSELGNESASTEQKKIERIAADNGMLLVGPNCAGVASPAPMNLYSGMIYRFPKAGGISMVSQSGNVGLTVLSWAELHRQGMARFVSSGNEAVTHTEDFLRFYADDPRTKSILSYVEGVPDGRRMFEALKYAASRKPVVLLKGGKTKAGMKAAQSHTGALAAPLRLFKAACRQAGVTYEDNIYEAMEVASAFGRQPVPKGRRVAIVSEGGGWGVIAADACADAGLEIVDLPEDTLKELDSFLPAWWSRGNPIDLVAGAQRTDQSRAVEVVAKCPEVDAVLVLGIGYVCSRTSDLFQSDEAVRRGLSRLLAMGRELDVENARNIVKTIEKHDKPVLTASDTVLTAYGPVPNEAIYELESNGVYVFASPTRAARTLAHMAERYEFMEGIPRKSYAAR